MATKCRAEFRLLVHIQFNTYSWDFHNEKYTKRVPVSSFSNLDLLRVNTLYFPS